MVELTAQQDFVVSQIEGLNSACVPVVGASYLEFAAISHEESDLEYEGLALLENHFDFLDVFGDLTGLYCLFRTTLTVLTVV